MVNNPQKWSEYFQINFLIDVENVKFFMDAGFKNPLASKWLQIQPTRGSSQVREVVLEAFKATNSGEKDQNSSTYTYHALAWSIHLKGQDHSGWLLL